MPSSTRTARRSPGRSSCASLGPARAPSWCAAAFRSRSSTPTRDPVLGEVLATAHRGTPADHRRRPRRGRPRGAPARVAAAPGLARRGRRGPRRAAPPHRRGPRLAAARPRVRATSIAAPAWRRRSSGPPTTRSSSTPPSAPSSTRAARRRQREVERQRRTNRRLRGLLAGAAVLLVVAIGGSGSPRCRLARRGRGTLAEQQRAAERGARRGRAEREAGASRRVDGLGHRRAARGSQPRASSSPSRRQPSAAIDPRDSPPPSTRRWPPIRSSPTTAGKARDAPPSCGPISIRQARGWSRPADSLRPVATSRSSTPPQGACSGPTGMSRWA